MAQDSKHGFAVRSRPRATLSLVASGALVVGIGLAGWYGWTSLVMPVAPLVDPTSPLALCLFGLLAGAAALFAPCAFPLFPAYVTWYLSLDDHATETGRLWRSLGYGLASGLGAIAFFLLVGMGLAALGGALSGYLIAAKPFIALILVGTGVAILTAGDDLQVEFVPVHYDHERLALEMEREGLPAEFVETIRTGWWTTCLEILPAKERARGKY